MCDECENKKTYSKQFNNNAEIVEKKEYTLLEKVNSFSDAMFEFFSGETEKAEIKTIKHNLNICANCDDLKRFQKTEKGSALTLGDRCGICGCFVKQKVKQLGKHWTCPNGKWLTENKKD